MGFLPAFRRPHGLALAFFFLVFGIGLGSAFGDDSAKKVVLEPDGNKMAFATTEIKAKAGSKLTLVFKNSSAAMQHNVAVLKKGADVNAVGAAATSAGPSKGYIPDSDAILASVKLTKAGETNKVTFTVPSKPGKYTYVCLFPGHYSMMQGTLVVE